MLNALIVDDEAPAREELKALLSSAPDIEIVGEASNAIDALSKIRLHRPDVVFLDIQMPQISGLEMVGMIDAAHLPKIVFVTAFDTHALKAFEEHATDYLLKPIDPVRLSHTLAWLRAHKNNPPAQTETQARLDHIPCTALHRIVLISLDAVEYIHASPSGIEVVAGERSGMTELTLKLLQERTPFVRCHRQYLVNLKQATEIILLDGGCGEIITQSQKRIPVSRRHLREIKNALCLG